MRSKLLAPTLLLAASLLTLAAHASTCALWVLESNSFSWECPKYDLQHPMLYASVSCDGGKSEMVPGGKHGGTFCLYDEALSNGLSVYAAKGYKITSCGYAAPYILTK
jgi:hypothetical protein